MEQLKAQYSAQLNDAKLAALVARENARQADLEVARLEARLGLLSELEQQPEPKTEGEA